MHCTRTVVATSGVAGPSGGTKDKPVGMVWMALLMRNVITKLQEGDRGREMNITRALMELYCLHELIMN